MFKGFQTKANRFNGFPNLNFQMNNEAYGFAGCTFWLDAAYGLNTQTDLAAVSSWISRIGDKKFVQATAGNQPRLILSDPNFNNYPTIDANQTSNARFMDLVNTTNLPFSSQFTIVIIGQAVTSATYNPVLGSSSLDNAVGFYSGFQVKGPFIYSSGTYDLIGTDPIATPMIVVVQRSKMIRNGVSVATRADSIINNFGSFNRLFRGTFGYLNGVLAECLIYNGEPDAITLCDNINSKYALY